MSQQQSEQHFSRSVWAVILIAFLLRATVVSFEFDSLKDDRDAYLSLASGLQEGRGFSSPGTENPTAFRPPLYPIFVAMILPIGGFIFLGAVQVVLGTATVYLTIRLGRLLNLKFAAIWAGGFVALDPLLLHYTAFPMTETFFTFLVILFFVVLYSQSQFSSSKSPLSEKSFSGKQQVVLGLLFGLCVLCRPSILAFPVLLLLWYSLTSLKKWWQMRSSKEDSVAGEMSQKSRIGSFPVWAIIIAGLVLMPWGVRNGLLLGKFTMTTTHGGYTVLLGNNPVFYENVVMQPWGTTWGDYPQDDLRSQTYWVTQLHEDAKADGVEGEVALDRWMYQRAFQNIKNEPGRFLRSSLLRILRFWSIVPLGPQRDSIPTIILWGIMIFYSTLFLLMLVGLLRMSRTARKRWMPLILLIVCFSAVHTVYWSNMRMRSPVVPVIALLAVRVFARDSKDGSLVVQGQETS